MYPMFTFGWFFHHPHALSTSGGVSEDIESLPSLLSWSPEVWPRSNSQIPRHLMLGMELSGTIIQVHLKWFGGHYTIPTQTLQIYHPFALFKIPREKMGPISLMTPVIRDVFAYMKKLPSKGAIGWNLQIVRRLISSAPKAAHSTTEITIFTNQKRQANTNPWKTSFNPPTYIPKSSKSLCGDMDTGEIMAAMAVWKLNDIGEKARQLMQHCLSCILIAFSGLAVLFVTRMALLICWRLFWQATAVNWSYVLTTLKPRKGQCTVWHASIGRVMSWAIHHPRWQGANDAPPVPLRARPLSSGCWEAEMRVVKAGEKRWPMETW